MIHATANTALPVATPFPSVSLSSVRDQPAHIYRRFPAVDRLVLVIEGSPTIQKIIELTLCREGYEVRCFRDGIDAMRWFAGPQAHLPDLMLVDLDLPKLDGYRVIQKFKARPRFAHTACLLLCEHEIPCRADLEHMDVAGSLRKPFTIQELVTAVHTSIASEPALLTQ
jgi:DNA-binding response OmpR family regulator